MSLVTSVPVSGVTHFSHAARALRMVDRCTYFRADLVHLSLVCGYMSAHVTQIHMSGGHFL
jgi:hypothetical protein